MKDKERNILLVDDEKDVRDILAEFLEENNYTVRTAADGLKALELIEESIPGLALVDLLLPGEHGINLIKTIKEKYFAPVIIISSIYNKEEIADFMEEYFVDGFIPKPIDLNKLLEKIESIFDAKPV
jgi:DNA-binding NtrC family response regulator